MTDPSCKVCAGDWPRADHFIADLGLSKAYLHDDQFFAGWTVVVFQRHATELFHLASTEDQDRLLTRWQNGKSGETRFFTLLVNLTLEGAFGDPSHGGNKGGAGFAMVGFEPGAPTPGHLMHHHAGTK